MKHQKLLLILCGILALLLVVAAVLPRRPAASHQPAQTTEQTITTSQREGKLIGVCLPSQAQAWKDAGQLLKDKLESAGYRVELSFGDDTAQGQSALLQTLIKQGAACLITAPADSAALTEAENAAREQGVPLLAYGSLLMNTDAVSGYICYNYYQMGVDIAKQVVSQLHGDAPISVELFMGSAKDYNAVLLHRGILSVLQPYIDSGALVIGSGRLAFEDCCISDWAEDAAKQSCLSRLDSSYAVGAPDVCICASDTIAAGVISALETKGVTPENFPIITGNGATQTGMDNLAKGKQALTVRLDATDPAEVCVEMVDWSLFGVNPDFALGEVYNNVTNVPTAFCDYELITKETGP